MPGIHTVKILYGKISVRRKIPYGEYSLWRKFLTAKNPCGENSVRRKILWRKILAPVESGVAEDTVVRNGTGKITIANKKKLFSIPSPIVNET